MGIFLMNMNRTYSPYMLDSQFALFAKSNKSIVILTTKMIGKYGKAYVDGKEINPGKCYKFSFIPMYFLFLPVGEGIDHYGGSVKLRLEGYTDINGKKFPDKTFKVKVENQRTNDHSHDEHDVIVKEVSDEGMVLLKNDKFLPMAKDSKVAIKGEYKNFRICAAGAGFIKPRWTLKFEEALALTDFVIDENADTVIYTIVRQSGENLDNRPIKGEYYLTDTEKKEIDKCFEKYKNVVLVLNTGYPIEGKYLKEKPFKAIIFTGFAGARSCESLFDILNGTVNPSGRLVDTWADDYYDYPSSRNFVNLNENDGPHSDSSGHFETVLPYKEGIFVGYRYFDTFNKETAYPFGTGLSYSSFAYEGKINVHDNKIETEVKVTNISDVKGKEGLFVFVKLPKGNIVKASKVLSDFIKTKELGNGESEEFCLTIPFDYFSSYDESKEAFILEKGKYEVLLGETINTLSSAGQFELDDIILKPSKAVIKPVDKIDVMKEDVMPLSEAKLIEGQKEKITKAKRDYPSFKEFEPSDKKTTFEDVRKDKSLLKGFIANLSVKNLIDFNVLNGDCFATTGAAGRLYSNRKLKIPQYFMSDGNCGVNLNKLTIGFASSNLAASTLNKNLAYKIGKVLAEESKEYGISINLGPAGNMHRNILNGRHAEYFSEDPVMNGIYMANQARGLEENNIKATYKHFFANNSETERKFSFGIIDEKTIKEIYLKVFEVAFGLYKPSCLMTSYNAVNGLYPTEDPELISETVRKEYGFEGFIMTDWESYTSVDIIKALKAGTNMLCPGKNKIKKKVLKAYKENKISKAVLQQNAYYVIKIMLELV